jgi:predicted lipoprotein
MKRVLVTVGLLVTLGVLFWQFPLFHVVAMGQADASRATEFSAADFVETFWSERLVPSFDQAADAAAVLAAIREAPDEARRRFGRSAGLGRATLYFLRGSGTVAAIDERGVGVTLSKDAATPEIVLQTGLVSGNTIRDATGLLAASDYPNSQQFNDISTELNRTVEATVIPNLKQAATVGRRVVFVGCARVLNLPSDVQPLKVIPLEVRFE